MSEKEYDAIILGAGLGGLLAGSLLVRRGLKVLILSQGERTGQLGYRSQDYLFEPMGGLLTDLQEGGGPHRALGELGLSSEIVPLEPGLQVVFPHQRLSLYSREDRFWREISREFPDDLIGLRELSGVMARLEEALSHLYRLTESGGQDRALERRPLHAWVTLFPYWRKTLASALEAYTLGPESRLLVNALMSFFGGPDPQPSLIFGAILWGLLRRGFYGYKGGLLQMATALEKAFLEGGGRMQFQTPVTGMDLRRKREVRVQTNDEEFQAHYLAVEREHQAYPQASFLLERRWWRRKKRGHLALKEKAFSLLLGVKEEVLPSEMREHLLIFGDRPTSQPGKDLTFLSLSPPGDVSRAPQGHRAMAATVFLSLNDIKASGDDEHWQGAWAEELLERLEDFIPSLSRYLDYLGVLVTEIPETGGRRDWASPSKIACARMGLDTFASKRPCPHLFFLDDHAIPGGRGLYSLLPALRVAEAIR